MARPLVPKDFIPDVRDGLNRLERVVLWQLSELQKERPGRSVPTAMLYGRVVEHVDVTVEEFQECLSHLVGKGQRHFTDD
jgi:hypothetical protein